MSKHSEDCGCLDCRQVFPATIRDLLNRLHAWRRAAEALEPLVHDCSDGVEGEHDDLMCKMGVEAHVKVKAARELDDG